MPCSRRCAAGPTPEICNSCGEFTAPPLNTTSRVALARYTTAGALDTTFGTGGKVERDLLVAAEVGEPEAREVQRQAIRTGISR